MKKWKKEVVSLWKQFKKYVLDLELQPCKGFWAGLLKTTAFEIVKGVIRKFFE